eukprot:56536-Eustigmatos_ZCMA.PRE.1
MPLTVTLKDVWWQSLDYWVKPTPGRCHRVGYGAEEVVVICPGPVRSTEAEQLRCSPVKVDNTACASVEV